jgi:putative sterol carrier protein
LARFLSPAWAEEFSAALSGLAPVGADPDTGTATAAPDGPVTVVEEVHGTPDGDVRLVLRIENGALGLQLEPGSVDPGRPEGPGATRPNVTIAVSYEDAAAMSRGELSPAEALNAGRIRVRGDLSALVAAQHLLDAARSATGELVASTTY